MNMIHNIVDTQPPDASNEMARQLLTSVRQYMPPEEVEHVALALQIAQDACKGIQQHNEASLHSLRLISPLEHALAVATILAQMRIDAIGVAAGIIFEAIDAERVTLEQVENVLGAAVARIVGSMMRLNILERKKQASFQLLTATNGETENSRGDKKPRIRETLRRQQAETVRKMFIGMAEDPRVVLLKLAYRLHAMRILNQAKVQQHAEHAGTSETAEAEREVHSRLEAAVQPLDQQEQYMMAQETRDIYAPLAGRLGMSRVESELEDLAFEVLEPDEYAWLRTQIESESTHWRSYVERVCTMLRDEMASIGLKAEVSGRVKHIYSFYKKLQRNAGDIAHLTDLQSALDVGQIHDLIAFRILVESTPDCYVALGHVHSLWKPKEGRIKDFIANSKPNGYSALHTTVFCLDEQLVEIQIRTFAMHEMAEYGVAMHWHYKHVGDTASGSAKELLAWLRQLSEWQRDLRSSNASDTEFVEAVKDDIFEEQIFVFTPQGDVKDLPVGSTPLDFAYRVHSGVGDKCAGARITTENGTGEGERLITRMVPLDYELKSGEVVEIITNRTAHPTRDWLNFARTAAARSKIRRYLKVHERDINIQIGKDRLDRELKAQGVSRGIEALTEDMQKWLEEEYRGKSFEAILAAIGSDEIRQHGATVKLLERWQQLREQKEPKEEDASLLLTTQPRQGTAASLEVAGVSGLMTTLANCCYPIEGDEIVGFVSRGKGVIIHSTECQNIGRYREHDRERLIAVNWSGMGNQSYLVPVLIMAHDRAGLIRDIATVISDTGVNMTSVNSTVHTGKQVVMISTTLEIEGLDQLQRTFLKIEKVKNVLQVERDIMKGRRRK